MVELKVISKKYNDEDILELTNAEEVISLATNLENGLAKGSLSQKKDNSSFTFVCPNSSRNGQKIYTGATGQFAVSLGGKSKAEGKRAVSEGTQTIAEGNYSHAEGNNSISVGSSSKAEGLQCVALGEQSHAEGNNSVAEGNCSHAEGEGTLAQGYCSKTSGLESVATAGYSSAHGIGTRAVNLGQYVVGKYNQESGSGLFVVGNGTGKESQNRSNIFVVEEDGIKVGGTKITEQQLIQLLALIGY